MAMYLPLARLLVTFTMCTMRTRINLVKLDQSLLYFPFARLLMTILYKLVFVILDQFFST